MLTALLWTMGKKKSQKTPEQQYTQDIIDRRKAASIIERSQYLGGKKFNRAREKIEESPPITPSIDPKETPIFTISKIIEEEQLKSPKSNSFTQKPMHFTQGKKETEAYNEVETGKKNALEKQKKYMGSP